MANIDDSPELYFFLSIVTIIILSILFIPNYKDTKNTGNINNKIQQGNPNDYDKICIDNIIYISYFRGLAPYVDPKTKDFVNCKKIKK